MTAPTVTERDAEPMAYAGYCGSCGGMVSAAVDKPVYAREVAKFVAEHVRHGDRIERVTCQFVRDNLRGCTPDCGCAVCVRERKARPTNGDLFAPSTPDDGGERNNNSSDSSMARSAAFGQEGTP